MTRIHVRRVHDSVHGWGCSASPSHQGGRGWHYTPSRAADQGRAYLKEIVQ